MNETLSKIMNHPQRVSFSVGVVSFGAGIGIGYILGKRNRSRITHIIPEQQVFDYEATENFIEQYEDKNDIDAEIIIPGAKVDDKAASFVAERIKESMTTHHEPEPDVVTNNVFAEDSVGADIWDYDEEAKTRSENAPYVLHKDEFWAEEKDYVQTTLTYYAGDNIMCSEEDNTPVYNYEATVGPLLFGHGSGDPKVFYVRNDKRKAEYEIIHDPGSYEVEVLGLEIENQEEAEDIKHSRHPTKFRLD